MFRKIKTIHDDTKPTHRGSKLSFDLQLVGTGLAPGRYAAHAEIGHCRQQ